MQIKTPCCKLYLQQGAEKQIEQLSVSFIRTIPSAPESHRISGCINSRSRACGNAIYRRWGIAPRPEDILFYTYIIVLIDSYFKIYL